MSKLIPMEEAAKFLGMSVDELNQLRENNEVFGYRDGSTWKFKMSELERVAGQSGINIAGAASLVVDKAKDTLGLSGIDDLSADADDLNADVDELSVKADDLSVKADELGVKADDLSLQADDLSVAADDLSLKADDLSDEADDLIDESGDLSFDIDDSVNEMVIDEDDSDSIAMEDSSIELFQPPSPAAGTSSDILSLDDDDDDDMIDLAESGLLVKGGSKASLLDDDDDGDSDEGLSLASSGLNLASDEDLELESKKKLNLDDVGSFDLADENDSILNDSEDELSFGSSSLVLASDSAKTGDSPSTGDDLLNDEPESSGSPSDTGKLLGDDDDLMLANDDLDLELADSGSFDSELSSSFDESAELVLEDDSSEDLMLEANESGIALSPNESGILLGDDPLELGGSDIDDLELPEDDDIIMVDEEADPELATMMQEDDFSLTPHELSLDEDDSSSSQVIALADSEIYADDSEATMLGGGSDFSQPGMLDDDGLGGYDPATGLVAAGAGGAAYGAAGGKPEAPYSLGQILALSGTVVSLFIGCIVAYGMAENLWLPDDQVVNSGLMNMLLDAFGLKS